MMKDRGLVVVRIDGRKTARVGTSSSGGPLKNTKQLMIWFIKNLKLHLEAERILLLLVLRFIYSVLQSKFVFGERI